MANPGSCSFGCRRDMVADNDGCVHVELIHDRKIGMPEDKKSSVNAKMINPFLNSTLEILREATSIDFKVGKFYVKKDVFGRGDVTGIIGLTGSGKGTVSVTFDESMILTIVSSILDEEFTEITDMVIDAAGELTNMITGRVVDKLAQSGFDLLLSVPTVVHGRNHRVIHHTKGPVIAIPFNSLKGQFVVEFSFDEKQGAVESKDKEAAVPPVSETEAPSGKPPTDWGIPSETPTLPSKAPSGWGMPSND